MSTSVLRPGLSDNWPEQQLAQAMRPGQSDNWPEWQTPVWNGAGQKPVICEVLDRVVQAADPGAKVWGGFEVPPKQGLKIFGSPFWPLRVLAAQLESTFHKQGTLIQRIPSVPDLQTAWFVLMHCASARANHLHRVINPQQVQQFAQMLRSEIVALFVRTLGNRTRHVR